MKKICLIISLGLLINACNIVASKQPNHSKISPVTQQVADGTIVAISNDKPSIYAAPSLEIAAMSSSGINIHPIGELASVPYVLATNKDSEIEDLNDLARLIKTQSDRAVITGAAPGGFGWIAPTILNKAFSNSVRFVNYSTSSNAVNSVVQGHTQVCFCSLSDLKKRTFNEWKILAVLSDDRVPGEYDRYPTAVEQGYDLVYSETIAFYTRKPISQADFSKIRSQLNKQFNTPEIAQEYRDRGLFLNLKVDSEYKLSIEKHFNKYKQLAEQINQ